VRQTVVIICKTAEINFGWVLSGIRRDFREWPGGWRLFVNLDLPWVYGRLPGPILLGRRFLPAN
jgi:hypothetical protein